jgi:aryl-alcohol dehydrogenase-like predicted oxidoreductase
MTDTQRLERIERLRPIADRLGATMAQLAIAWCARHPMVSSVITGASRPEQVTENFGALDIIDHIDDDLDAEIRAALR